MKKHQFNCRKCTAPQTRYLTYTEMKPDICRQCEGIIMRHRIELERQLREERPVAVDKYQPPTSIALMKEMIEIRTDNDDKDYAMKEILAFFAHFTDDKRLWSMREEWEKLSTGVDR